MNPLPQKPPGFSRWIIPDIHGFAKTLRALIETQICPGLGDELCFLGDYIDRGPDSRGVINYIRSLQDDGYSIVALRGNHEAALTDFVNGRNNTGRPRRNTVESKGGFDKWYEWLRNLRCPVGTRVEKAWLGMGGDATLRSFGVRKAAEIPEDYLEWMNSLGWYHELEAFVVVHAGLNFRLEDPFEDRHTMLWARDFEIRPEKIGGRRIIHGHVPVSLEMINLAVNNPKIPFIDLDNGPYIKGQPDFGNLCALEVNRMRLVIQHNVD